MKISKLQQISMFRKFKKKTIDNCSSKSARLFFGTLVMAFAITPSTSFAANTTVKIDSVRTYADSNLILGSATVKAGVWDSGCTKGEWVLDTTSTEQRDRAYKMLMAAYLGGKELYISWKVTCGAWNRHSIDYMEIR